jgi:hypothetical protein
MIYVALAKHGAPTRTVDCGGLLPLYARQPALSAVTPALRSSAEQQKQITHFI